MIKAIFFDIDGTLVSFQTHRIPESAKKAISRLREMGIKVFIATGRHWRVINNLDGLEFDGYITLNGSCCYVGKDKVIYRRVIPQSVIRRLLELEKGDEKFPCIFVEENGMFMNYSNDKAQEVFRLLNFPEPPLRDAKEALETEIFQLIAFFREEQEEHIMQQLPGCEATRWNPLFTDVIPAGGSKRIGMEKILTYFGLRREECMAFGDGGNDIPMLEYAGVGVAMGNARAEVRQTADFVTKGVDEDGIAFALHALGILSEERSNGDME